jgi:UDP-N-acetyl-D-glucosamine/UDP-N-acetyl-D-galactosamine dehydrogenase
MSLTQELHNKQATLAVVGLGYVGLPIALEFAKYFKVIGFDINQKRVEMMQNGIDPSQELDATAFEGFGGIAPSTIFCGRRAYTRR